MKKNICKMDETRKGITYKAICNCGCEENSHVIDIERDDYDLIGVTIYSRLQVSNYYYGLWRRIKVALNVLFGKYVEAEGDLIMDEESLEDYIEALQGALNKFKNSP
jgi:hypothetical protein